MVGLVVLGAFVSTVAAGWIRSNVIDVDVPFADALYALLVVLLVRTVMGGRASLLVAAGAGTGIVVSTLDEVGL